MEIPSRSGGAEMISDIIIKEESSVNYFIARN